MSPWPVNQELGLTDEGGLDETDQDEPSDQKELLTDEGGQDGQQAETAIPLQYLSPPRGLKSSVDSRPCESLCGVLLSGGAPGVLTSSGPLDLGRLADPEVSHASPHCVRLSDYRKAFYIGRAATQGKGATGRNAVRTRGKGGGAGGGRGGGAGADGARAIRRRAERKGATSRTLAQTIARGREGSAAVGVAIGRAWIRVSGGRLRRSHVPGVRGRLLCNWHAIHPFARLCVALLAGEQRRPVRLPTRRAAGRGVRAANGLLTSSSRSRVPLVLLRGYEVTFVKFVEATLQLFYCRGTGADNDTRWVLATDTGTKCFEEDHGHVWALLTWSHIYWRCR